MIVKTVGQNPVNSIVLLTLQIKMASQTPSNSALRRAQIAYTGILDAKIFSGEAPQPPYERGTPPLVLFPTSALVYAFGVRNTKKKSLRP